MRLLTMAEMLRRRDDELLQPHSQLSHHVIHTADVVFVANRVEKGEATEWRRRGFAEDQVRRKLQRVVGSGINITKVLYLPARKEKRVGLFARVDANAILAAADNKAQHQSHQTLQHTQTATTQKQGLPSHPLRFNNMGEWMKTSARLWSGGKAIIVGGLSSLVGGGEKDRDRK